MAQRTRPPQPRTKPALRPTRLRTNRRERGMEMNHDTEDTIYPCRTVDPETFFPEGTGKGMLRYLQDEAKKLCAACPVREACLQAALDNDERFGVWGGMTEDERAELRK